MASKCWIAVENGYARSHTGTLTPDRTNMDTNNTQAMVEHAYTKRNDGTKTMLERTQNVERFHKIHTLEHTLGRD